MAVNWVPNTSNDMLGGDVLVKIGEMSQGIFVRVGICPEFVRRREYFDSCLICYRVPLLFHAIMERQCGIVVDRRLLLSLLTGCNYRPICGYMWASWTIYHIVDRP